MPPYQVRFPVPVHITYGGKAQELPNIDPVTRAILLGFLSRASVKDVNNVNVRSIASSHATPGSRNAMSLVGATAQIVSS